MPPSLAARAEDAKNAIDIGSHSVGMNPIGSDMPVFAAFGVSFVAVDHGDRIARHVGHIEAAAVRVDCQRNRLGAKIALARQPRVKITLHRKLPRAHIHRSNGIAIGERNIERLLVGRKRKCTGMRARRNRRWAA